MLRTSAHGQRSRSPPRRPISPPRRPATPPRNPASAPGKKQPVRLTVKAAPAVPTPPASAPPASAASGNASKSVGHFPLTNKEAEALLALEGGYFLELARSSKAKLALIPKTETGTFEIQACGAQEDIKATRLLLSQVLNDILLEAGVATEEAPELETGESVTAEEGHAKEGEVEERIELPDVMVGVVVSGRRPGEKGMGMSAGIADLQAVTGAVLTPEKEKTTDGVLLVLKARGTPASVESLKQILQERMDEWKDLVEEFIEAPSHVKGVVMKNVMKIEAGTETMISLQSKDGMSRFRIAGVPSKVSAAKVELQGFCDTTPAGKGKSQSQGKGREKRDGKGKQSGERTPPWATR